ncbi:MAG: hypothetical protein GXO12_01820 [Epsilonproteobacteria bacterium]|nr:hypothetical protein [Campylobacterota bacterium]
MILRFDFEYVSTSGFLYALLEKKLKESSLKGVIANDGDKISLYVEADEESLKSFADDLSLSIPYSIFLKDTDVTAVSKMPTISKQTKIKHKRALPFCPECYKKALKSYDPFVECEACGYGVKKSDLVYKNFAKTVTKDNKEIFSNLAKAVSNGGVAKIKTFNGIRSVGLVQEKYLGTGDDFEIVCADLDEVHEYFQLDKAQMLALGSFEKPVIALKPKNGFFLKYPFLESLAKVKVRLSDDLILEILINELKSFSLKHIFIKKVKAKDSFNLELGFESDIQDRDSLEAVVLKNAQIVLKRGIRTLLPKVDKGYQKEVCAKSEKFLSKNSNGYIVTNIAKEPFECDRVFSLAKGELSYKASHGAFYASLSEHGLYDKTIVGVYMSKEHESSVMIYSDKFGLVEHMKFEFSFPNSVEKLMESLSKEGKTSLKLVSNYMSKFSKLKDKKLSFSKAADIFELWGVAGIVLGLYEGEDVKESAKRVLELAESFNGKKGPRIDYKLKRYQDKPVLDASKVIKTSMSYKLASMDAFTLCYGIVESFAEFVNDLIDEMAKDYSVEGVCFGGSLFESEKLLEKFYTITDKNYKVYPYKEFILDDMNLGYGIINAALRD